MFESVLIANRGEIACRIIRSCRRLGIRTVAVYSDADAGALHVRQADAAVHIGPSEAASSYLDVDAIIKAALQSGAQAIHPGYGFLSENSRLPRACAEHGIAWVGPRADVIERMGSKIESKRIAVQAGVPCVPGCHGENQDPDFLLEQAAAIGTPLLIKASAGGGGRGMRRVDDLADFLAQLALAKRESAQAFGDDQILLEKLILRPRHLEVQLAGDQHGNLVHVFERECSIQRNYQKVIEEAPAADLPDAVRSKLFEAALKLGREIGYDSLGTVEFVLQADSDEPYFLEMNTRLQVEHPVTEMVAGIDLVEWQLRIASGEPLPMSQDALQCNGWAIEARINCEDPANGYRPMLGAVQQYTEPTLAGVRVDSGIATGSEVTPHYDSMIAKIIGYGPNRAQATESLSAGLAQFSAIGIGTNQAFLASVIAHPLFRRGRLTTGFLAEAFPEGWASDAATEQGACLVAALHFINADSDSSEHRDYWQQRRGYRFMSATGRRATTRLRVVLGGTERMLAFEREGDLWRAQLDGESIDVRVVRLPGADIQLVPTHGLPRRYSVTRHQEVTTVTCHGMRWQMNVMSELQALGRVESAAGAQSSELRSEMPGSITAVNVSVGDDVAAGDVLVVMEAMKLIYSLTAPQAGKVTAVHCSANEIVSSGEVLVQLEPVTIDDESSQPN